VYEWAKNVVGLDDEDADILRVNKVTGSELLTLTKEELYKEPYKMPGGPAIRLAQAIEKLKILPGNHNKQSILYVANVINV
jgi:hypothetical protein